MEWATTPCNWSGLCVYSSVLPWHVCTNRKQENRLSQHQLQRRPQVNRAQLFPYAGFDSQRRTQHTNPCAHSRCCRGGFGDGTEGCSPIKYLSVCWAECQLSQLGKCYVGIKVGAVPERKAWLCRTRTSIHFVFSSKNLWHVYPVMGCKCTNIHKKTSSHYIWLLLVSRYDFNLQSSWIRDGPEN